MRRGAKPGKAKVNAKPPVTRKAQKSQGARVRDQEKRLAETQLLLAEALQQQTATSEILRVISSSSTDVQPVLDTIVGSAVALCDGLFSTLFRFDGEVLRLLAAHNLAPGGLQALHRAYPTRPTRALAAGRAILDRAVIHIPDVELDPEFEQRAIAGAVGWRSALVVPMLREGAPIGVITVGRAGPGPFSQSQIELLQTFADQAVIAIENVRLFTELQEKNRALTQAHGQVTETLERQTATSEILRVISSSLTDVNPVFRTILTNANRLCDASFSVLWLWDGEAPRAVAHENVSPEMAEALRTARPLPNRRSPLGLSILEQTIVHVANVLADPRFTPEDVPSYRLEGARSILCVPMVREGSLVGLINIWRREPRAFTDGQIALVRTFADQAVIAIENVRLFTELEARNADLTESLARQTATADILRVISRSQTHTQPVFDAIVASAVRLLGGYTGALTRVAGDQVELAALTSTDDAGDAALRASFPRPLHSEARYVEIIRARTPVNIADAQTDSTVPEPLRSVARTRDYRSWIVVPLLRHDEALGTISVTRREPGGFTDDEIALLQTFADQAVIAIENVRLFSELQASNREIAEKSRQIEVASQHKSDFLANMSHELRTPLNAIIGYSELLEEEAGDVDGGRLVPDLQKIATAAKHQLSLINDILDLSKVEAGRMELEVTAFDLPAAIDSCLTLVRERATRRGIGLGHTIGDQVGVIQGDERKVKQVLLNLLSNALKFTPEGGRIEVHAGLTEGAVEVAVRDTGMGIAPEDQEAVFEEFRQVGTADRKAEGTGLGLALCRRFVELHGGRIRVASEVGQGATFAFTLPVRREA